MTHDLLIVFGGLGLFLLGMVVMTEGLRAVAGDRLNRVLFRFTKTPWTGALSGAAVTAVVQSSSATTVAIVGFVSAGLMSFSQALGALFGTNIGTTVTGWLVALVGFKFELGLFMMPLLLVGVMLRLFGRRWSRDLGWAVAGFALVFIGIESLRDGMAAFEGAVTPADFPDDTLGGRLLLVLIGGAITLVTQSSSAGVATALTALYSGAISFHQAAAMVIGMDVGTTSTTALATLGGSPQTRRTGYSHVIYNMLTGVGALLILDLYTAALDAWVDGGVGAHSQLALVGFHTTFNLVGVLVVLPFTRRFAALMFRLVPDRGPRLTRRLDPALCVDAAAASLALLATVRDLALELYDLLARQLDPRGEGLADGDRLDELAGAVAEVRRYADRIETGARLPAPQHLHLSAMHALDHLDRLADRCRQERRAKTVLVDARLAPFAAELRAGLKECASGAGGEPSTSSLARLGVIRNRLKAERRPYRTTTLIHVSCGAVPFAAAIERFDAVRWLHRCSYHAWRIAHHLLTASEPVTSMGDPGDSMSEPGSPKGGAPGAVGALSTCDDLEPPEGD